MTLIEKSGAPRGERYFAIYTAVVNRSWHPALGAQLRARRRLSFLTKGLQTIVFAARAWPPRFS